MKLFVLSVFVIVSGLAVHAQDPALTTFILVRHAEKGNDGTNNPPLSEEGEQRARALAQLLSETKIDAIYSTPYHRTLNTVRPLAAEKGLELLTYEPKDEQMDRLLEKHKGKTVLISGHSNTTPWVANYFLGKEVYPNFDDADYDNILILSIIEKGKASVTRLTYGKPTR